MAQPNTERELTSYEFWQLEKYGNIISGSEGEDTELENRIDEFEKEN